MRRLVVSNVVASTHPAWHLGQTDTATRCGVEDRARQTPKEQLRSAAIFAIFGVHRRTRTSLVQLLRADTREVDHVCLLAGLFTVNTSYRQEAGDWLGSYLPRPKCIISAHHLHQLVNSNLLCSTILLTKFMKIHLVTFWVILLTDKAKRVKHYPANSMWR